MLRRRLQLAALIVLAAALACSPGERRVNVLLIIVDTLRADRLGCYGNTSIRTPNIDRLAREGVRFETVVTASPVTAPSVATILTSTYPVFHRLRDNELFSLNPALPTLASSFRDAGYTTGAFVGSFVLSALFGFDQGFVHYDDDMSEGMQVYNPAYASQQGYLEGTQRRASTVTRRALKWLEKRDRSKPFFCLVHYFDPHMLYDPPPPFKDAYTANAYDGEIAYTDAYIGILLEGLKVLGVEDNTLIIFTADHGESLGEHGEDTHGFFMYEATMLAPLVFHQPERVPAGKVVRAQVRTVDIMPTILDMTGLDKPQTVQGESLSPALLGDAGIVARDAYIENFHTLYSYRWHELYGIRTPDWKYIRAPREELYDLGADTAERVNLYESRHQVAERLKAKLSELEARLGAGREQYVASRAASDPQATRKMRALGYLGGPNRGVGALPEPGGDFPDPKDAMRRFNRRQQAQVLSEEGRVQLENNDCAGAARSLEAARELVPDHLQIAINLSIVYERCGQRERAAKMLETFLEANPAADDQTRHTLQKRIAALRAPAR